MQWGIDCLSLSLSEEGLKVLYVAREYLTKWVEIMPAHTQKAELTVKFIQEHIIERHGVPVAIITDGGPEYKNKLVASFCKEYNFTQRIATPNHPQPNGYFNRLTFISAGLVEASNKIIRVMLKKMKRPDEQWPRAIGKVAMVMCAAKTQATGFSPFELCHGCAMVLPHDAVQRKELRDLVKAAAEADPMTYAPMNKQDNDETDIVDAELLQEIVSKEDAPLQELNVTDVDGLDFSEDALDVAVSFRMAQLQRVVDNTRY